MRDSAARHLLAGSGDTVPITSSGFAAVVAVVITVGAVVFGLLASRTSQPVLLTLMALLTMLGSFFLLAVLAGHLRLTERMTDTDLTRALAQNLDEGVLVTARGGATTFFNAAWQDFVGRGIAGSMRTLDQVVVGESDAAEAYFRLSRAADEGRRHSEELRLRATSDATARWYRLSVAPLQVNSAAAEARSLTLWSARDISEERARQASQIAGLEARLGDYSGLPVGVLVFGSDGIVRRTNAAFDSLIGLQVDSGRAMRLDDLMSEDSARLLVIMARTPGSEGRRSEVELLRDDGTRIPVTVIVGAGREHPESATTVAVMAREAEPLATGRSSEIRFSRLFQSAPFGIATVTADGSIISANPAFGRMLLEPTSLEGRKIVDLACRGQQGEAHAFAEKAIGEALAGKATVAPLDVPVGPQGDFTRRLYMSGLARSPGAREAAVLFLIDATEQKALEVKFAQSQKMEAVGKLAGGIAHDFNNVLTAIIGFSDLLLQTHRPTDPAYKDIMNIKSSANRAAGMVRQLLAFSRRQTLQAEVLQLGEVITDLSALLTRAIGEKIGLKIHSNRDLWYVKADKTQFEQVIINLAVNAGDAMPDGGRLSIRARNLSERESTKVHGGALTPGEYVLVEVEDTGVGMSPEILSKIFEPFFTTKGVGKGTGLGLSTVYGIVKQTGGFIYPESTPGKGTTFRVYLPRYHVENEDEVVAQKAQKKERPVDLTGTGRVLLVEDEDVVRNFAVRALKRQGYEVLEAGTGLEALEVMKENAGKIDIVVSDVVMPEMDGPTLLKELRKTNPELKIIFVSGYPDDAFKKSLDENEQFAFLPKPFSLPQLAQKVKEQLGR